MTKSPAAPNRPEETHWEKAAKTRMGKYLTQIETDFIRNSIELSLAKKIMDVGAEAGRFSRLSTDAETSVVSIDIDSYGLRRLKQKMKGANVVQADARCVPFRDGTFDAIFMIEVIDYIPQLDVALAECNRTLRNGKSLILSFGNKSSLKAKLREIRGKSYKHSYRRVVESVQQTGLVIEQKKGYNWLPSGRTSDSRFISVMAWFERVLRFGSVPGLSPWVILKATKQ